MSLSPIDRFGSTYLPAQAQPTGRAGFSVPAGTAPACPDVRDVARPASVGASLMLALQEQAGAEAGDREARRHGHRLLAALSELQRAMLCGGGADTLRELSRLSEDEGQAADPVLAGVIRSIRLRARLELARAAKAANPPSGRGS